MSLAAITQPTKIYAGVSGAVNVPAGCVLLYLTATGNGTIGGFPDGQGNQVTITIPNTSQWFLYQASSLNIIFKPAAGSNIWTINFSGTTSYLFEVMNPAGGF